MTEIQNPKLVGRESQPYAVLKVACVRYVCRSTPRCLAEVAFRLNFVK